MACCFAGGDWAVRCTMAALPAKERVTAQGGDGHGGPEGLRGSLIFYIADESVRLLCSGANSIVIFWKHASKTFTGLGMLHMQGAGAGRQGSISVLDEDQDGGAAVLASGDTAPIGGWRLHAAAPTGTQELQAFESMLMDKEHCHVFESLEEYMHDCAGISSPWRQVGRCWAQQGNSC